MTTAERAGGDKGRGVFAGEGTLGPEAAGGVPEGLAQDQHGTVSTARREAHLELGGHVAVTGGDTKDKAVELGEVGGGDDGVGGLGRRVHEGEDLVGEGLCNPGGASAVQTGHSDGEGTYW